MVPDEEAVTPNTSQRGGKREWHRHPGDLIFILFSAQLRDIGRGWPEGGDREDSGTPGSACPAHRVWSQDRGLAPYYLSFSELDLNWSLGLIPQYPPSPWLKKNPIWSPGY